MSLDTRILIVSCRHTAGVLLLLFSLASAEETAPVPIEQIPKLPESFQFIDYRDLLAGGTLLPDRVSFDSIAIQTGQSDAHIRAVLPDSAAIAINEVARTREQQWEFLRSMLYHNNYSMHYYMLAGLYYDRQLYGWFKTYEWRVAGTGVICVHLNRAEENDRYRVWLIEMSLDAIPRDSVRYESPPAQTVVRNGDTIITWKLDKNRIFIRPRQ